MQQKFILLKTFGNDKKVRNNYETQNTDRLKKPTALSIALKYFMILL